MLLTVDINTTYLTLGLYKDKKLWVSWRLATDTNRMADEYGLQFYSLLQHGNDLQHDIEGICISSIVPSLTGRIIQACHKFLNINPLVIDNTVNTGVNILCDDPASVSIDHIVEAVAVQTLYGGPACIIDFSTATSFGALTTDGEYIGGAIAPGIQISADALFNATNQLAHINIQRPPSVIGNTRYQALQSGILFGHVALVEGMVNRFRSVLGDQMKVIATGSLVDMIAKETKIFHIIEPWLTLEGLRIIWEMNHQ